ncbi:MAG: DNA-directed RNA polymerase subunit P [Nitrospirota bacterium]|jgi:DNA-directed RNA polymerase subunit RPC12/RpoP
MKEQLYICRRCRHEFTAELRPAIYACPRCGSSDTMKYNPASLLSMLFSGGG